MPGIGGGEGCCKPKENKSGWKLWLLLGSVVLLYAAGVVYLMTKPKPPVVEKKIEMSDWKCIKMMEPVEGLPDACEIEETSEIHGYRLCYRFTDSGYKQSYSCTRK